MYSTRTGLVLGFHGCDKSVVDKVLNGHQSLRVSNNKYDWLGNGVYFWENSPSRALEYATHLKNNPGKAVNPIKEPAVIGAVLNLGYCLDLLDYQNLKLLKLGHQILVESYNASGYNIPKNKVIGDLRELLLRELDCAVIETLHKVRKEKKLQQFDSVRGVFWEGEELYPNAGFREKDHIQICIRNPNCIKGYFLPKEIDKSHPKV
ncbi:hypothetical protein KZP23_08495 [Echinicola marina]|uniref:hypothetical protein n=1 Tax=Echinicola marina TaxID=2859768 RepID=UPI001CF6CC75|nr:hypothetical protein [Echinicola marina]UCS95033.1 hypothetical protein KZP23_08495 [Echinicola marina]